MGTPSTASRQRTSFHRGSHLTRFHNPEMFFERDLVTVAARQAAPALKKRERETSLQWPHDRRHPPLTRRESTAEETRNQGRVRATAGKQHHAKSAQATAGHGPTQATLTRQNHHKSPHWLTCPSPAPLVSRTSKGGTRKEGTKEQTAAKAG